MVSHPEGLPSPEQLIKLGDRVERGIFEKAASEITESLRSWHRLEDTDSIKIQRGRAVEFYNIEELIQRLVKSCLVDGKGLQLNLKVGTQEVRAWHFDNGPYDMDYGHPLRLQPGSNLKLARTKHATGGNSRRSRGPQPKEFYKPIEQYVGDFEAMVPTSSLAKTLAEEGEIIILDPS